MKRLLPLLLPLLLLTASCVREARIDEELILSEIPCLQIKGKRIHTYDPANWQLAWNASLHRFRAGNDNMSEYFVLTCSDTPAEAGQSLDVSLSWTQNNGIQQRSLPLKVEKISDDGTVWLWNGKESIGAVVRILQ